MISIDLELSKHLETKLKEQELLLSQCLLRLLENDLDSTIELGEGFYFNAHIEKLFTLDNEEVPFPKIEKELIITLIERSGDIIEVDIWIKRAWEKDNVSVYTFRNMIKKLRNKTYHEIIRNHSNYGYVINIKEDKK